MTGQIWEHL